MNDFRAQWTELRADAIAAFDRVGSSGWLILGDEVQAFENALAVTCGISHAVGCASGLDAIEIGLRCLGIGPGDHVLTSPLSAFATTLAILRAGAIPAYVDVDESGLIDLDLCDQALSSNPSIKSLVPVHLFGHALDLKALKGLRERHNVAIVEDCAQAIGATSHGAPVGSVGQAAALSFYPTKNLGAMGDGGALLTDTAEIAESARKLRDYGQSAKYEHSQIGLNSRLDEVQAAIMGRAILPKLARFTRRRREIADLLRAGVNHPCVELPPLPMESESVWHLFPVMIRGDREAFRDHLSRSGVASAIHYPRVIPDQPVMRSIPDLLIDSALNNARYFASQEVSLPIHPYLTDEEVSRIIDSCNSWRPQPRYANFSLSTRVVNRREVPLLALTVKYSLVIPVYRNESSIAELLEVLDDLNARLNQKLEVVFVVDGSPDASHRRLGEWLPNCGFRSQLLLLSRNFGSFAAIRAGLGHARGNYFGVMAADLQETPELMVRFFETLEHENVDVVVGMRESREDSPMSRIAANLYWAVYRKLIQPEMPPGGVDVFGCNRAFRERLLSLEESNSTLVGLLFWLGFSRKVIGYKRQARKHGKSAWSLHRKVRYLTDSAFAFSDLPIRLLVAFGAIGLCISVVLSVSVMVAKLMGLIPVPGYAATILTIIFFGAINTLGVGIVGAYVWRAFENTKGRPLWVVQSKSDFPDGPSLVDGPHPKTES